MTRPVARRWLRPWSLAALHWLVVFPCFTPDSLAERWGVSGETVRQMCAQGRAGHAREHPQL